MTTREIAVIIWGTIFLIFIYYKKLAGLDLVSSLAKSTFDILKVPISRWILFYNIFVLFCVNYYCEIYNFYMSRWYIKDYAYVLLFVLFPLVLASKNNRINLIVRSKFKEFLVLTGILAFISETYTFNLFIELVVTLFIGILVLMIGISETREEFKSVNKIFNTIFNFIIILIIFLSLRNFINNVSDVRHLDFWFSYGLELFVILVNLPMLYVAQKMILIERLIGFSDFPNSFFTYIRYYCRKIYKKLKYRFLIGKYSVINTGKVTVDKAFYGYPKITINIERSVELTNTQILDLIAKAYVNSKKYFKVTDMMINYPIYIEIVDTEKYTIALWQEDFFSKNWLTYDPFSGKNVVEIYHNIFKRV